MNTKHQAHNLIVLDESGSMGAIAKETIQGFNEIVQTIKGVEQQFPEQEHFISLISFNGLGRKIHLWQQPVAQLVELDGRNYQPDASTPLFDALGISIGRLAADLAGKDHCNVLVTVFTDGEENASVEFSGKQIKNMIEELKEKRWTFTYIGTDHDVDKIALSISINNVMKFGKTKGDMSRMFDQERSSRMNYSTRIRRNEDTKGDFYKKDID